jgi:hypothetical protein
MTIKEFVLSPIYYIRAGKEYMEASRRLTKYEILHREGKISFSEYSKAFDEYMPFYEATWKYFGTAIAMIWVFVVLVVACVTIFVR